MISPSDYAFLFLIFSVLDFGLLNLVGWMYDLAQQVISAIMCLTNILFAIFLLVEEERGTVDGLGVTFYIVYFVALVLCVLIQVGELVFICIR